MKETMSRRQILGALGIAALPVEALCSKGYEPLASPPPAGWRIETPPEKEGFSSGPNGDVYYRIYGRPGRTPAIVLHGGPGAGEVYMRPYAGLATDRQIALYDQSGCGRSASPHTLRLYDVERYVAELEDLRAHLQWEKMILIGHSWGSFLGPLYAAAHPDYVAALILAGGAPRVSDCAKAAQIWLEELGPEAVATVARVARTGAKDDPAYRRLVDIYSGKHYCRLDPLPAWFVRENEKISANPVYNYMNGPSEFELSGALARLDITRELRGLRVPTLITCGEYDQAPPWLCERMTRLVDRSVLKVFPGLSHASHVEDPAQVMAACSAFLTHV
jgi:proline iminopeptidase